MEPLVETIVRGYKDVHAKLREAVQNIDPAALSWQPASETNSIAVLVVHTLGSEAEVFRVASNAPTHRDRAAEFLTEEETAANLVRRLDAADALLDVLASGITATDLDAVRPRGGRGPETCRHWLVTNYGHAREHLAHIELTRQLYEARRKS